MPLYQFNDGTELNKYQHVERVPHAECEGLLDGDVYVQEKLDGANLTVVYDGNGPVICSRNRLICSDYKVHDPFNGACDYILDHDGIANLFGKHPHWILRGEWLKKHQVKYNDDAYGHFYVYDVQDRADDMRYLRPDEYQAALIEHSIRYIAIDVRLSHPKPSELVQYATHPSSYGPIREGVVVKRYGFKNKWGHVTWAKVLNHDYDVKVKGQAGKQVREVREAGDLEKAFVAKYITDTYVVKEILKLNDELGKRVEPRDIPRVMQTVWYHVFQEELWTFIKDCKQKSKVIDFDVLKKLVTQEARSITLRYAQGEFDA